MVKLDLMSGHLKECDFNPKKPVSCAKGCGLTVPKDEVWLFRYRSKAVPKWKCIISFRP